MLARISRSEGCFSSATRSRSSRSRFSWLSTRNSLTISSSSVMAVHLVQSEGSALGLSTEVPVNRALPARPRARFQYHASIGEFLLYARVTGDPLKARFRRVERGNEPVGLERQSRSESLKGAQTTSPGGGSKIARRLNAGPADKIDVKSRERRLNFQAWRRRRIPRLIVRAPNIFQPPNCS
jgi:hypothetical protein